jgi:hypothetical protein
MTTSTTLHRLTSDRRTPTATATPSTVPPALRLDKLWGAAVTHALRQGPDKDERLWLIAMTSPGAYPNQLTVGTPYFCNPTSLLK